MLAVDLDPALQLTVLVAPGIHKLTRPRLR